MTPSPPAREPHWGSLAELAADVGLRRPQLAVIFRRLGVLPPPRLVPVATVQASEFARAHGRLWQWDRAAWGDWLESAGLPRLSASRRRAFVLAVDMADRIRASERLSTAGETSKAMVSLLPGAARVFDVLEGVPEAQHAAALGDLALEMLGQGFDQSYVAQVVMVVSGRGSRPLDLPTARAIAAQAHAKLLGERMSPNPVPGAPAPRL